MPCYYIFHGSHAQAHGNCYECEQADIDESVVSRWASFINALPCGWMLTVQWNNRNNDFSIASIRLVVSDHCITMVCVVFYPSKMWLYENILEGPKQHVSPNSWESVFQFTFFFFKYSEYEFFFCSIITKLRFFIWYFN